MNMRLSNVLFFLLVILFATGCNRKGTSGEADVYQPASPLYTATYDYSVPPVSIAVEQAISAPSAVKLSEIASEIKYFPVGDQTFPVTQVIAIPDGFITFNKPRTFLCREGEKRKRVGFKALLNRWGNAYDNKNLYYDKATTRLYCTLKDEGETIDDDKWYIAELPPLDSILERERYLFPDSVPRKYYLNTDEELFSFTSEEYILRHRDPETQIPTGVTTFNLKGDTLCRFDVGVEIPSDIKPNRNAGQYYTSYRHDGLFTFRLYYCDTIFRLLDRQTILPAYAVDLGKYKACINSLAENEKGLFLGIHEEGKSQKINWEGEPTFDIPSVNRHVVYLKGKEKTVALPVQSKGLVNDLDNGLPFWPDGQTEGWLYMIRHVTELLDDIYEDDPHRYVKLRTYLEGLPQNRYIMILVK